MEVTGTILVVGKTKEFGSNGFRKRELVVETEDQYPQTLLIEFVQDKCDLLNKFNKEDFVKIGINLRGREWINPEGEAKYFNSIQGWRIENLEEGSDSAVDAHQEQEQDTAASIKEEEEEEDDDVPF